MGTILQRIQSPTDLQDLTMEELRQLAEDIRQRIIDVVYKSGGHLASNLGVTDLTIALHRVFDFKHDRLVFDVGHQCYPHKLITGRHGEVFDQLRQRGGVSGFPNPHESEYDLFDVGHAGTAIATAVGLARGDQIQEQDRRTVAVVGDASIVNGVAFEGLNQAGTLNRQFLAILNDNSMGIAKTQGALASHLARFRTSALYEEVRTRVADTLPRIPLVGQGMLDVLEHIKEGFKATFSPHQIFEQLGFIYVGPVDGHDLPHLIDMLNILKKVEHPVLLHVHTVKGRGCDYAMEDPCTFHSPGKLENVGNKVRIKKTPRKSWTTAFADAVIELMTNDDRVYALTAAMPDGTGLAKVRETHADRVMDCGIAESCTMDIAAGMAKTGLRPITCIYSTFLQRAFDQVFQEVVLQELPVAICSDRAGMVGGDGAVHHGYLDLAFLRPFQNIVLMAPADEAELKQALTLATTLDAPNAMRYPRDVVPEPLGDGPAFVPGKSRLMLDGPDATILAYGATVPYALAAADTLASEGIFPTVVNARFCKPIDEDMVTTAITRGAPVITVEDHAVEGGFGSAVLETANRLGLSTENLVRLGHQPNVFYRHGSRTGQLAEAGIDAAGIASTVRRAVGGRREGVVTPQERVPQRGSEKRIDA